jgi:hypothetical protein
MSRLLLGSLPGEISSAGLRSSLLWWRPRRRSSQIVQSATDCAAVILIVLTTTKLHGDLGFDFELPIL